MLPQNKVENQDSYNLKGKHRRKVSKLFQPTDETVITTKQKTYATIQQTADFHDLKTSLRCTHFTSRKQCLDRLEACELSPFSSPERSTSPAIKELQKYTIAVNSKKNKKSSKNPQNKKKRSQKTVISETKKNLKTVSRKKDVSKKISAEFKNQFLLRMNMNSCNQKITEMSEQEEKSSIRKQFIPSNTVLTQQPDNYYYQRKQQFTNYKTLHKQIQQKNKILHPRLAPGEIQLLSAVILCQRIWRQRKVKSILKNLITPPQILYHQSKENIPENNEEGIKQQPELKIQMQDKIVQDSNKLENSVSKKSIKNICTEKISIKQSSQQIQARKVKYIEMYRQLTLLQKKQKIKQKKRNPNVFNIPESLSENCLLDRFYRQSIKKTDKTINNLNSHSKYLIFPSTLKIKKQKQPQTIPPAQIQIKSEHNRQQKQEKTVRVIGSIGEQLLKELVAEFSKEYYGFSEKKCLKKKRRTPGIKIDKTTINNYLNQFVQYIDNNYPGYIQQSFTIIAPINFLKIFRVDHDEQIFEESEDYSFGEEFDWPVLPVSSFFEYQKLYESNVFKISDKDQKYMNFLLGLVKIHNKSLTDCLAECIQKQRVNSFVFPWESFKINPQPISIEPIIQQIVKFSSTHLGKLTHLRYEQFQETELLKCLKSQYKEEGKDWDAYSEKLQLNLQLTNQIQLILWNEVASQIFSLLL